MVKLQPYYWLKSPWRSLLGLYAHLSAVPYAVADEGGVVWELWPARIGAQRRASVHKARVQLHGLNGARGARVVVVGADEVRAALIAQAHEWVERRSLTVGGKQCARLLELVGGEV